MKEVFTGFKNQWTKWAAIGLIVILASMAYVHLAREWSAFRVLLIAVVGLTLGLVESHIPGPSHVFTWVNASRLLGAALIIFLLASFVPKRTKAATEWIAGNIDKSPSSADAAGAFPAPTGCLGKDDRQFLPETGIRKVKVPMSKTCFSGFITTPADWPRWDYQSSANKGFWIWFLGDKAPIWLAPGSVTDFSVKRGIFRVAGEGTLFVIVGSP